MKFLLILMLSLFMIGCGGEPYKTLLDGSWSRCSDYTKVDLTIDKDSLFETITSYSNADCTGAMTSSQSFSGSKLYYYITDSRFNQQVAHVKFIPSEDLFNCGKGKMVYTRLTINSSRNRFSPLYGQPVCLAKEITHNVYDPNYFSRVE